MEIGIKLNRPETLRVKWVKRIPENLFKWTQDRLFGSFFGLFPLGNLGKSVCEVDRRYALKPDPQKPRVSLKPWLHGGKLVYIPMTPDKASM